MSNQFPTFNGTQALGNLQDISVLVSETTLVPQILLVTGKPLVSVFGVGATGVVLSDIYTSSFPPLSAGFGSFFNNSSTGLLINRVWTPSQPLTALTLTAAAAATPYSLSLTSVGAAIGQAWNGYAIYTGTITGGAANAFVGYTFVISGFINGANNGTFVCTASTATTLTLFNSAAVAETHAATAASGTTVYTGTITGGASNSYAGGTLLIAGFTNSANNGSFLCVASSATTLTLLNSAGVSETHAGTATINSNFNYSGETIKVAVSPIGNPNLDDSVYVSGLTVNMSTNAQTNISGSSSGVGITAIETENSISLPAGNTSTTQIHQVIGLYTESLIGNFSNPDGVYNLDAHYNYHCAGMGYVGHATGTITSSAGIFMEGPRVPTGCTLTARYGLFMQSQAQTSGGSNASAWGIFENNTSEKNALGSINIGGSGGPLLYAGTGVPGAASVIGGLYHRTDGTGGTAVYVKETGTSTTGWVPFRNAALNAQSGTSYAIQDSDRAQRVTLSNTAAVAVTIAQAGASSNFLSGWYTYVENINTGTVTITPATSTINGFTSIQLFQFQWAIIFSDGTNYQAFIQPFSSNDSPANVSSYLANDAGTAAARNQIITRNINTGVNANRKGLNIYFEHDGAVSNVNYDSFQVNTGFTVDAFTNKTQSHTDGTEILAYGAMMNATFTSVANASAGSTVYTGTIQNGANNGGVGLSFIVIGFTNGANNGTFTCTASTANTLTLSNASGVAETHAASALVASTFTLTSVANHSGATTVYTGTIPGGGSNFYSGWQFRVLGFTTTANNGLFLCSASTTTTLTLSNAVGVSETHAATAAWMTITEINILKLRWGATQNGNILNNTGILQYLPKVDVGSTVENYTGHAIDSPGPGGNLTNYTGVVGGSNLNGLTVQNATGIVGFFIDSTVTNAYGGVFGAKSGSVLADDGAGATRSFIGHANLQLGPPFTLHDGWYGGTATPEGALTAAVGSMFSRQDSTIGDALYIKGTGSGNTGWAPSSTLAPIVTKVTTYAATNSDGTILGNGTFTVTMPNTGVPTGKKFVVKNIGTGSITVSCAVNIDGASSLVLNTQYQSIEIQWDGTQYWII